MIDYFRGRLLLESVYTKHNKAILLITFEMPAILNALEVLAQYTSHIKGDAYKFVSYHACVSPYIHSNVPQSMLIYFHEMLYHLWYMSHKIYYHKKNDKQSLHFRKSYVAVFVYQYLNISHFECINNEVELLMFPGLLYSLGHNGMHNHIQE